MFKIVPESTRTKILFARAHDHVKGCLATFTYDDVKPHDLFPCARECSCGIVIGLQFSEALRRVKRRYSHSRLHSLIDVKLFLDRRHKVFPLK